MNTYSIITEKMISGGDCIAKPEGKTIFIKNALPGETLEVKTVFENSDYIHAEIVSIKEASPHRITPACPYYNLCGGCNFQIADIEYQRELRTAIVKEACSRAGITANELPVIQTLTGAQWEYRNRFQLHDGGLKERSSNKIIPISDCPIAAPVIRDFFKQNNNKAPGRVHIFGYQNQIKIAQEKAAPQAMAKKSPGRTRFAGTLPDSKNRFEIDILDKKIAFDILGFFQSNIEMLQKTIELLSANLTEGNLLADIYGGVATLSMFAGEHFNKTYLIEHNRDAIVYATENLSRAKIAHSCYGIKGERWTQLPEAAQKFDAILIDPPRTGIEKPVRDWIAKNQAGKIMYLSCDPVTMSRDVHLFIQKEYYIKHLYILDYYPQTSHIETLVILQKNET